MDIRTPSSEFAGRTSHRNWLQNKGTKWAPPFTPQTKNWHEWRPNSLKKVSNQGGSRVVSFEETIKRVLPLMPKIGVTRIADVTNLDRPGIPNFITVRPMDKGPGISYYNGKGCTPDQARAGAMMEAIERFSGESWHGDVLRGTMAEMASRGAVVDPRELIIPAVSPFEEDMALEWVEGWDLLNLKKTYVPLNSVVCPYEPNDAPIIHLASTNGLAAGNSMEEALCQALCEVIERDATAIGYTRWKLLPAIERVCAKMGYEYVREVNPHRLINLETIPEEAQPLIVRLKEAGLRVYLRDITSTAGIAVVDGTVAEYENGVCEAHGGCGAHPDARVALFRAITEAAQSRVAVIQGGREDLAHLVRRTKRYDPEAAFAGGPSVQFSEIPTYVTDCLDDEIRYILSGLERDGFSQVVAVDMTHPEVGVPVVRVVLPRAEAWPVFHFHTGSGVFGPRVAAML
jgi:ribosomal protein S12 methylthiotransferase accessory factor